MNGSISISLMRLKRTQFANACLKAVAVVIIGSSLVTQANAGILGGFQNASWTLNNGSGPAATIDDSTSSLTITSNAGSTANSAYFNTVQTIGGAGFNGFIASFNYTMTASGGPAPADGFSFVIQNAGINAVGGSGSDLGYAGIGNSASVQFNIWPFNGGGLGTNYYTNGNVGSSQNPSYIPTDPVNLSSGDTIAVTLAYNPNQHAMSLQLTDNSFPAKSFFDVFTDIDIGGAVGGNSAFVGFTGGDGLGTSTQVLDSLTFNNNLDAPPNVVPEPSTLVMWSLLAGLLGTAWIRRRMKFVVPAA